MTLRKPVTLTRIERKMLLKAWEPIERQDRLREEILSRQKKISPNGLPYSPLGKSRKVA